MARVWSMRFNSDSFNHAYAGLDTDEEKAQFVTGLYRGTNGVPLKEGQALPMLTGHAFGLKMREEAEASLALAAIHGAMKGKGKDTPKAPSREPGGSLEGASGEAGGSLGGCLEGPGLRIKDQGFPSQEGTVPRLEPTLLPAPPKKRTSKAPDPKPKLEAILGPKGSPDESAYWKLVGIFGAAKNPAPTQTAQAFVDAMLKVSAHSILAKAQNLRDATSDQKFMPKLQTWLDGQGYMNPDSSMGSGRPMAAVTDEYTRYLDGGEVADAS